MTSAEQRVLTQLVGGRIVVGGGALVAPRTAGKVFGIDPDANPAAAYVGRLFGARAVLMAAQLATASVAERPRVLAMAAVVDVVDAWAAVDATRRGQLSRRSGALATAAAVSEATLGLWLLTRTRSAESRSAQLR